MASSDLFRLAGQLVAVGPEGSRMDAPLTRLIEDGAVGSVILFRRNCPDSDTVRRFLEALQRRARTPLLTLIDQEGGRVQRLVEDRFTLPSARELAGLDAETLEQTVYLVARRLKEIGLHVNLAPVLDIDSNPANPVIGDRAFGRDIETVWACASAYRCGLRRAGLFACGKHFPGHGDTEKDSHLELPVVRHDRERLLSFEIEPFRRAAREGWKLLMASHVLYPALDPDEPASLSHAISTDLLRRELGFRGVLVSDDVQMKAVAERYPVKTLVERFLNAGMDLLLVCNSLELTAEVHRAIVRLVEDGVLPMERVRQSAKRIHDLKRDLGLFGDPVA